MTTLPPNDSEWDEIVLQFSPRPSTHHIVLHTIPTVMRHKCKIKGKVMDPQPEGAAYLVYQCPKCKAMATTK